MLAPLRVKARQTPAPRWLLQKGLPHEVSFDKAQGLCSLRLGLAPRNPSPPPQPAPCSQASRGCGEGRMAGVMEVLPVCDTGGRVSRVLGSLQGPFTFSVLLGPLGDPVEVGRAVSHPPSTLQRRKQTEGPGLFLSTLATLFCNPPPGPHRAPQSSPQASELIRGPVPGMEQRPACPLYTRCCFFSSFSATRVSQQSALT